MLIIMFVELLLGIKDLEMNSNAVLSVNMTMNVNNFMI